MIKKLIQLIFEKAKLQTENNSPNGQARHISSILSDNFKHPISEKSLIRYLKGEIQPKKDTLDAMSKYLDYKNYEDFIKNNRSNKKNGLYKIILIVLSSVLLVGILYFNINWKQKEVKQEEMYCMEWKEDHYEKIVCDETSLNISYNQNVIENFKKVELDTTMVFFKKGKALYWYDKTGGKIEFFTKGGRHPTNDKVLKPVTQTIIRKYIFGEE